MTGVAKLAGAAHRIDGDFVEAGSWAVAAAVTGGEVEVRGARALDLEPIVAVLSRFGVSATLEEGRLRVRASSLEGAGRVTTGVWPGFPTDMVSLVTVLATQARGSTLVHDWLYELRLFGLEQLSGMGADLFLCDPHRIVVTGPRRLRGRAPRQPRPALRDGPRRRRPVRRRREPRRAARDDRTGLCAHRREAAGPRRQGPARRLTSCPFVFKQHRRKRLDSGPLKSARLEWPRHGGVRRDLA